MTTMTSSYAPSSLPDPATQAEFYEGVPFKRFVAWIVDAIIITAISAMAIPFTAFTAIFYFPLLMLIVGFIYRWGTIASRSSTWGMRLMAIELRDMRGNRLSSGDAFAHTAGYTASVIMAPAQLISMLLMAVTPKGQGLSDHLLGTTAINRPAWT